MDPQSRLATLSRGLEPYHLVFFIVFVFLDLFFPSLPFFVFFFTFLVLFYCFCAPSYFTGAN